MSIMPAKSQVLISIFWPSFLLAGVFSAVLFAFIDPLTLLDGLGFTDASRNTGYSLCFLGFWAMGALSSAFSIYILCTPTPPNHSSVKKANSSD